MTPVAVLGPWLATVISVSHVAAGNDRVRETGDAEREVSGGTDGGGDRRGVVGSDGVKLVAAGGGGGSDKPLSGGSDRDGGGG